MASARSDRWVESYLVMRFDPENYLQIRTQHIRQMKRLKRESGSVLRIHIVKESKRYVAPYVDNEAKKMYGNCTKADTVDLEKQKHIPTNIKCYCCGEYFVATQELEEHINGKNKSMINYILKKATAIMTSLVTKVLLYFQRNQDEHEYFDIQQKHGDREVIIDEEPIERVNLTILPRTQETGLDVLDNW